MFEAIAIIAVVLAIAIAAVLILAASKPNTFSVERAISVKAPPEKIFALINDFHQWVSWSPYENKDPAMKRSYERGRERQGRGLWLGGQQAMSAPGAWRFWRRKLWRLRPSRKS